MRNVFKKGDIITGVSDEFYSWTTDEMTKGIVIETYERDEEMLVEILEHKTNKSQIGHRYTVDNNDEKFRLIQKKFDKSMIKDGVIITLDNDDELIYDKENDRFLDLKYSNCNSVFSMEDIYNDGTVDRGKYIVNIKYPNNFTTIYEKENEVKEMTVEEISKALGYEVKIVKEK